MGYLMHAISVIGARDGVPSRQNRVLGNIRRELHEAGLIQRPREHFEAAEWMEHRDDKLAHYEGTKMQKEVAWHCEVVLQEQAQHAQQEEALREEVHHAPKECAQCEAAPQEELAGHALAEVLLKTYRQ